MHREDVPLAGAALLTPKRFGDPRGWFSEVWNARALAEAGIETAFVQDNHSFSGPKGTLRGLHYQAPPHGQAKLVRCSRGAIWDVCVDVRHGSPTYGQWFGAELSADNGVQYFVPVGFLHGFVTVTDDVEVQYKCSDYYAPEADGAVKWDSLNIDWPLEGTPILSGKDEIAPNFADWDTPFGADGGART